MKTRRLCRCRRSRRQRWRRHRHRSIHCLSHSCHGTTPLSCFISTCNEPSAFLFSQYCRSQSRRYPTDIWFAFRHSSSVNYFNCGLNIQNTVKKYQKICEMYKKVCQMHSMCQFSSKHLCKVDASLFFFLSKRPTDYLCLSQRLVSGVGSAVTSSAEAAFICRMCEMQIAGKTL